MTNDKQNTKDNNEETIEPVLDKVRSIIDETTRILAPPHYSVLYDITKSYEILYGALAKLYERYEKLDLPPNINKEFLETLRKELDKKLKPLENQYITFEVSVKDDFGNVSTKKVHVNAKVLIDAITEKFGLALWEHLAIRLPPPELYILILQHIDILYNRVAKLETSLKYITESLVTITEALALLDNMLRKLNSLYNETEQTLERFNETIKKYTDILESLTLGLPKKPEQ
ncbi:MAG: hypothetical protein QXW35_02430 [Candidatus Aenigmatarchaeota archaeon]